jgi:hypothetical protein
MKKVLICHIALIVSFSIVIGCTCSDPGIVGTWKGFDGRLGPVAQPLYIFNEDNTCVYQVFNRAMSGKCEWTKLEKDCQYEVKFIDEDGSIFNRSLLEIDGDTLVEPVPDFSVTYKRVN